MLHQKPIMNDTETNMKDQSITKVPIHKWQGKIDCQYINKEMKRDKTRMKTALNCFVYGLVLKGSAEVNYENNRLTVTAGDLLIFAPLSPPKIEFASDDFEGISLFVSSEFASESHNTRNMMMSLILTQNQPNNPVIKLTEKEAKYLEEILHLVTIHMQNSGNYTYDALQSLYGLYLADLMGIIENRGLAEHCSIRSYKIFLDFSKLLNEHFRTNHDITFYADKLGISARYLSMVTKEISHTTVATFINRKIMFEACWLLKTTDYSILKISEMLHFSDQASFSKFFKRVNGIPPLQFRRG